MKTINCCVCHKEIRIVKWLVNDMGEDVFVCETCQDIEPLCETCGKETCKGECCTCETCVERRSKTYVGV
jgi:hypothetical protein